LPDRRGFLTRLAFLFGGVIGALILPSSMVKNDSVFAVEKKERAIEKKQSDLLAACQNVAKRMGVFRDSTNIWHYANDGEIEMTWTMILPPEKSIDESTLKLAQQVNSLVQSN